MIIISNGKKIQIKKLTRSITSLNDKNEKNKQSLVYKLDSECSQKSWNWSISIKKINLE